MTVQCPLNCKYMKRKLDHIFSCTSEVGKVFHFLVGQKYTCACLDYPCIQVKELTVKQRVSCKHFRMNFVQMCYYINIKQKALFLSISPSPAQTNSKFCSSLSDSPSAELQCQCLHIMIIWLISPSQLPQLCSSASKSLAFHLYNPSDLNYK